MTGRTTSLLAALLAVLALTAGCGVPQDDGPRALDPSAAPFAAFVPEAAPEPQGDRPVALYLVRADRLQRTERRIETPAPSRVLRQLLEGPTSQELTAGLTTAIPATVTIERLEMQSDIAVVSLAGLEQEQIRTDQLTAFAQIVATLDALPGVEGVRFRSGGADLEVPRGDSSLTDGPLKAADYAELLQPARPESSPAPA
jgi:hypothetical protein